MKVLTGKDGSVNFVEATSDGGYFESRYVRRSPDYFICYLSSHSGCNKGCRFCHLTTTKQTMMQTASVDDLVKQAKHVLEHYGETGLPAKYIHFNWMARGEPLVSETIIWDWVRLSRTLMDLAGEYGLIPRFNISTIMPRTLARPLDEIFRGINPTIYYSLYSTGEVFRDRWLPAAMQYKAALGMLAHYQKSTKKIIKIHFALIAGENDLDMHIAKLKRDIEFYGLQVQYNLVRYNPYSEEYGTESEHYERLNGALGIGSQIIPRVGPDVFASCGMFYEGD